MGLVINLEDIREARRIRSKPPMRAVSPRSSNPNPGPNWIGICVGFLELDTRLTSWEGEFVRSLYGRVTRHREPTPKQIATIKGIYRKLYRKDLVL